jgi:hypothetical protein
LFAAATAGGPAGVGDFAILVLLARLGLRAGEVARLELLHAGPDEDSMTAATPDFVESQCQDQLDEVKEVNVGDLTARPVPR